MTYLTLTIIKQVEDVCFRVGRWQCSKRSVDEPGGSLWPCPVTYTFFRSLYVLLLLANYLVASAHV
jgi:hypothetical protein